MAAFPAKSVFETYLAERNISLDTATPANTVPVMTDFYRSERVAGCELDADGNANIPLTNGRPNRVAGRIASPSPHQP